jgi:hypothetical protein
MSGNGRDGPHQQEDAEQADPLVACGPDPMNA